MVLVVALSGLTVHDSEVLSPILSSTDSALSVSELTHIGSTFTAQVAVTLLPSVALAVMVASPTARVLTVMVPLPLSVSDTMSGLSTSHSMVLVVALSGLTVHDSEVLSPILSSTDSALSVSELTHIGSTFTAQVAVTLLPSVALAVMVASPIDNAFTVAVPSL